MNKHEIASLASKLAGLYSVIHSISYLSALGVQLSFAATAGAQANGAFVYTLTPLCFVVTLGLGLFLFFSSDRVATVLLGNENANIESAPVGIWNVQVLAFSIIGLYVSFQALPGFIRTILSIWFTYRGWLYRSAIRTETYIDLGIYIVQIGLGIWLLLGASGFARVLNKLRGETQ
jgi:hypothetical protein